VWLLMLSQLEVRHLCADASPLTASPPEATTPRPPLLMTGGVPALISLILYYCNNIRK